MASPGHTPKTRWGAAQRFVERLADLTGAEVSKLIRQLPDLTSVQQGIKISLDILAYGRGRPVTAIPAGRPVTAVSAPTAHRARKLGYAADLTGQADPGEIVWTWVVHPDDADSGTDRPVLVVGRDRSTLLGLLLSSESPRHGESAWVGIGSGGWVRLDRVFDVPEEGIRREGAILAPAVFEVVAARLRSDYSWS